MALRRLLAAVAFTVLLGGTPSAPARATEPHHRADIPAAAAAELDAGLEAMRTLSIRGGRIVRLRAGTVEAALSPMARALPGGIGYLELPTSAAGDPVAFVGQAERAIAAADATGTCGWVLDLRRNRGGDPFRLLAAAG